MADRRWLGRAQAIAQVDTVTIALTWAQNDTVTLEINDKQLVVTVGTSATTADVATLIKEAWENETLSDSTASFTPANGGQDITEFAEITATVSGSVVTLTHDTAGVPFTLAITGDGSAGDGTATVGNPTAATGPNFWDNVDNWDTGLPVATDSVYIDNTAISILYNLEPSIALTLLEIGQNFTGTIGLPQLNGAGYVEYRPQYLKVGATTMIVGRGEGAGSGRIKIDAEATACAILVENTGNSLEFGLEAFLFKGTATTNTLTVHNGSVGLARFGGETANIDILRNAAGTVVCGAGVDFTSGANDIVSNEAGTLEVASDVVSLTNSSGTVVVNGSAAVTTLNANGGTVDYRSTGTITTANVGGSVGATLDFSNSNALRTITTCNLNAGGTIIDPANTATFTPAIGTDVRSVSAD